jgi:hypothetical protein
MQDRAYTASRIQQDIDDWQNSYSKFTKPIAMFISLIVLGLAFGFAGWAAPVKAVYAWSFLAPEIALSASALRSAAAKLGDVR